MCFSDGPKRWRAATAVDRARSDRGRNAMNWTVAVTNVTDEYDDAIMGTVETTAVAADWRSTFGERFPLSVVLMLFCMVTVFGNCLVIIAVVRERYLHTATNYFITSLAFADFLVGLVVMPVSAVHEVLDHYWTFGINACDVWRSLDVLFSTASILNLCVISLDRYWAITDPFTYPTKMSRRRAYRLIAAVWVCSSVISFPAIIWWRLVRAEPVPRHTCPFTNSTGYLIFSSTISFYVPLLVMVFTYYKIYTAAVTQTRCQRLGTKVLSSATSGFSGCGSGSGMTGGGGGGGGGGCGGRSGNGGWGGGRGAGGCGGDGGAAGGGRMELTLRIHRGGGTTTSASAAGGAGYARAHQLQKNFSLSRKLSKFSREKKAAKTLGIVMGVFIVCWLPFFVVNLLSGFCDENCVFKDQLLSSVVTWLGWINSGMNPVIYACWSRDFRR